MSTAAALSLPLSPKQALGDHFGFADFRPGQEAIVQSLLDGHDTLAVMPTGAGKSLCFQLPALLRDGFTVVVSPLIALMESQVASLQRAGIAAGMIHHGRQRADNVADWRAAANGQSKLLYMSPERLMSYRMTRALKDLPVSAVVVDEAHCISQWGHHFRQEYLSLAQLRESLPKTPLAAFTATADEATRKDIVERLFRGQSNTFVLGFDRPNISIAVKKRGRVDQQLLNIVRARRDRVGVVYCRSRKTVEKTASFLRDQGMPAVAYHAGLPDNVRSERLSGFLRQRDGVIVATVAFGMGVDKPDIRYVVHRDLPGSLEAYHQEIGRAGRDGAAAEAILLYGRGDLMARRKMIDASDAGEEVKRVERGRLDRLVQFCETTSCRRSLLLSYFGEGHAPPCQNCDVCDIN